MQLSAVILARAIAYIEVFDLNPRGQIFFPQLVPQLVERYSFQSFPKALEQMDITKGIEFLEGRSGKVTIGKFGIWDSLLVVETRSSTQESKRILEEILAWGSEKFGLNYKPGMITRFAYISDVTFYSEAPLLGLDNPALSRMAASTSAALSEIWQEPIEYYPAQLGIGHDPIRKNAIAGFTLARRAESRRSENKYFSEAPLPTDLHLRILEEYEQDLLNAHRK